MRVGILGLGLSLPAAIRDNSWWSSETVKTWVAPRGAPPSLDTLTPGMRAVLDEMRKQTSDPFGGTQLRHVLGETESLLDHQVIAARQALAQANVALEDVDLLLTSVNPVDHLLTNASCELHEALRLPRQCFSLLTEGAQSSFLLQLTLAESMISAGRAKRALIVQASAMSRLTDPTDQPSAIFGDGVTAAVIGPVSDHRGILAQSHFTDGRLPNTLVASVRGKRWYDEGRPVLHLADSPGMFDIVLRTVDLSVEGIGVVLQDAGLHARDVDVFIMHQGFPWMRELVQAHAGLSRARSVETFSKTAHLFSAFVPSTLVAAQRENLLGDDRLVLVVGGGSGMTYGATLIRWGT